MSSLHSHLHLLETELLCFLSLRFEVYDLLIEVRRVGLRPFGSSDLRIMG